MNYPAIVRPITIATLAAFAALTALAGVSHAQTEAGPTIAIVVGAPGTEEYRSLFEQWATRLEDAATRAGAQWHRVDGGDAVQEDSGETDDRTRLQRFLEAQVGESDYPLWLVFIGHGTFDGQTAKFNLAGPDVSAAELSQWLAGCKRPLAIINCASSSGPFVNRLSAPDRVIVTATRSGFEQNYARFGEYFSAAIADPAADLDKDDQTSLLEAFVAASARVEEFYSQASRLATEHALLDDNGDGLGTPASFFRGVRAVEKPSGGAATDGTRAHQLHLIPSRQERRMPVVVRDYRDRLEQQIAALRDDRPQWDETEYYARLEDLAVSLARVYQWQDAPPGSPPEPLPAEVLAQTALAPASPGPVPSDVAAPSPTTPEPASLPGAPPQPPTAARH
ncbi:MAG: hypothetical protein WDZ59_00160 [Pirellulales bacterium]